MEHRVMKISKYRLAHAFLLLFITAYPFYQIGAPDGLKNTRSQLMLKGNVWWLDSKVALVDAEGTVKSTLDTGTGYPLLPGESKPILLQEVLRFDDGGVRFNCEYEPSPMHSKMGQIRWKKGDGSLFESNTISMAVSTAHVDIAGDKFTLETPNTSTINMVNAHNYGNNIRRHDIIFMKKRSQLVTRDFKLKPLNSQHQEHKAIVSRGGRLDSYFTYPYVNLTDQPGVCLVNTLPSSSPSGCYSVWVTPSRNLSKEDSLVKLTSSQFLRSNNESATTCTKLVCIWKDETLQRNTNSATIDRNWSNLTANVSDTVDIRCPVSQQVPQVKGQTPIALDYLIFLMIITHFCLIF